MEDYAAAAKHAERRINIADHMLSVTYPLIRDPKLLLAILKNIFSAYKAGITAIVFKDRALKKIPPIGNCFESVYNIFKQYSILRHKLKKNILLEFEKIREILDEQEKSTVQFSREDRLVFCSDTYRLKTLAVAELKKMLSKAKLFIGEMSSILSLNE